MPNRIHCETHGECEEAFVCSHLADGAAGLGFNRGEPSEGNPFPEAWCDDCDVILQAHQGWNDESEKLITIRLLCSGCYEKARIRNRKTEVTLDDLANLRWKCHSCEEWHAGACLDFSYDSPVYWTSDYESGSESGPLGVRRHLPTTFLDEAVCIIDGQYFFIRGLIHLPIIGTAETFCWGVWGSLSKENFEHFLSTLDDTDRSDDQVDSDDPKSVELPPMFSWLSNQIDEYPDTVNLKMYAHIQNPDQRPTFELEPTDHPLSQEYHHGITAERVKEIMTTRLRDTE